MTSKPAGPARGATHHPGPPADPADLDRFPSRDVDDEPWYRTHVDRDPPAGKSRPVDHSCWWFSAVTGDPDDYGRFDLPRPEGTCCLGSTGEVAARERVGPWIRRIAGQESVLETLLTTADGSVVVSRTRVTAPRTATLHVRKADRWVNRSLWVGTGIYAVSQAWAAKFRAAGFDALIYEPRFAGGNRARSIAVFGATGRPARIPSTSPPKLLADVLASQKTRIVPVPPTPPATLPAAATPPPF